MGLAAEFGWVWLNLALFGCIWVCLTARFGWVWLNLARFGWVWLGLATFD